MERRFCFFKVRVGASARPQGRGCCILGDDMDGWRGMHKHYNSFPHPSIHHHHELRENSQLYIFDNGREKGEEGTFFSYYTAIASDTAGKGGCLYLFSRGSFVLLYIAFAGVPIISLFALYLHSHDWFLSNQERAMHRRSRDQQPLVIYLLT